MTQSHYNDGSVKVRTSGTIAWSSGVKLGDSTWGGFNWDDKYIIIALSSNGIPKEISFTYYNSSGAATGSDWYVAESADNSSFVNAASWSGTNSSATTKTVSLKKSTKYIKLCYSGNFAGTFANIKVIELQSIEEPSSLSLDFGLGNKDTSSEKTINVEWVNVPAMTYTLSGTDDSHVSVSISNNSTKGSYGTATFSVQYKRPTAGETLDATLTIKNAYNSYSKAISLSGSTANQYFVSFDGNGSTSGSMTNQTFNYGTAQALTENSYVKKVTLTYNPAGGNCNSQSEQIGLPFMKWEDRGNFYADKEEVNNLSAVNGDVIHLYAQWGEGTAVLPTPTRENYVFIGWYDGDNFVGMGGDSFLLSEPKTLTAHWDPLFMFSATANRINPEFGTVTASVENSQIQGTEIQNSASTSATFIATPENDCTFEGWYSDEAHSQRISTNTTYTTTITNEEIGSTTNLTLYAWFKKNQTLNWNTQLADPYGLAVGSSIESSAIATSSLPVTYQSSNSNIASVSEEGVVTGVASSPDAVTITVSQSGNEQYNAAEPISRTFLVLEKLLATFYPNGFEGTSPIIKIGDTPTITLDNVDADFSFDSSDESVISIARDENILTLTALKAGTSDITLSQPANNTHNASSTVYHMTVERLSGHLSISIPSEMRVGEASTNFYTTENNEVNVEVSSSNTNAVSYSDGILTAVGEGTAIITVSQQETEKWSGESKTQTVIVNRNENTLNISIDQTETEVDGTIPINVTNQNNTSTALSAIITETVLSSSVNNGTDVIVFEGGVIKAKNAGTAKIKIVQEANAAYEAYESQEYTILVQKVSNHISVTLNGEQRNSKNVARGTTIALAYTSPSNAQYNITRTSGNDAIATISGNTIVSGQQDGTSIWTISQAETYKYEAAEASVRIKVNSTAEEDSYLYTAYTDGNKYDWNTGSGKYSFNIDYEPLEIRFKVWYSNNSINSGVNEYVTLTWKDSNGTTLGTKKTDFLPYKENNAQSYTIQLPSDARSFTFEASGSFHQYVKEVYVVRKTYIRTTADKTNLGTIYTDQTAAATFTVDYGTSNGGPIEVISSNNNFSISQTPISVDANSNGRKTFVVTYTPNPDQLGEESAIITANDLFNSSSPITLTASCQKYSTIIGKNYEDAAATMSVGDAIDNAFSFNGTSTSTPSNDQGSDFYFVNSNPSAVNYDPTTNQISAIGPGTATITFFQKKTTKYHATSQQFTFEISRNRNPLDISIDKTSLKVEETANVTLTNNVSDGEIVASYTNQGVVSFNSETREITATGEGSTTITLTQVASTVYESKSKSFNITVTRHDQTISWDNEVETSLLIGSILTTNTATASSGLQVTYSSNSPAISVDTNTGALEALAGGLNITITATQAGNYKYNPASITRNFTVWDKINASITTTLFEDETNELPIGNTTILSSNAPIDNENINVIGNEDNIIAWTLSDNVLTIYPIKEGTVTIEISRASDNSYFELNKSYTIKVIKPVLVLDPAQAPNINYNEYSTVSLKRTLPAGYCTICLPFCTTTESFGEGAWAAQLSLVTYNANDGFTLFFTRCYTIEANKPYILHLNAQIENPCWTDVTGVEQATAQSISDKGWTMIGNYTPNLHMEGKYGVVSSTSNIRKGGSESFLNAYTAYFTCTGSANVKVSASYLEEDGEIMKVEDFDIPSLESKTIYDLQGRKVEKVSKGIYIVNGKKLLK